MHVFLFLETIGTSELMLIAFVALIVFGPRKLPELGRTLGRSLGEFKRASDDFKRTWEHEVDLERLEPDKYSERAEPTVARFGVTAETDGEPAVAAAAPITTDINTGEVAREEPLIEELSIDEAHNNNTIAHNSSLAAKMPAAAPDASVPTDGEVSAPAGKQDWL